MALEQHYQEEGNMSLLTNMGKDEIFSLLQEVDRIGFSHRQNIEEWNSAPIATPGVITHLARPSEPKIWKHLSRLLWKNVVLPEGTKDDVLSDCSDSLFELEMIYFDQFEKIPTSGGLNISDSIQKMFDIKQVEYQKNDDTLVIRVIPNNNSPISIEMDKYGNIQDKSFVSDISPFLYGAIFQAILASLNSKEILYDSLTKIFEDPKHYISKFGSEHNSEGNGVLPEVTKKGMMAEIHKNCHYYHDSAKYGNAVKQFFEGLNHDELLRRSLKLAGRKKNLFRLRWGDYRVIYSYGEEPNTVIIVGLFRRQSNKDGGYKTFLKAIHESSWFNGKIQDLV